MQRDNVSKDSQTVLGTLDEQRRAVLMERVILIGITACAVAIGLYGLYVLRFFQIGDWQILAIAGFALLSLVCLALAGSLVRRGKLDAAGYWILASTVVAYGGGELVLANVTLHLTVGGILLILLVGNAVLPRKWRAWLATAGLFAACVWLVNQFEPLPRYDMAQSALLRLYIIPVTTALVALMILWQSILVYRRIVAIGGRLLTAFVLMVLLPAVVIVAFSGLMGLQSGQEQVINQLESVVTLKEAEIETWVNRLQINLALALAEQEVTRAVEVLLPESAAPADRQGSSDILLRHFWQLAEETQLFEEVFLMDLQGQVVLSTDATQEGKIHRHQTYFREGLERPYVQPPFYSPSLDRMSVVAVCQIAGGQEHVLGVLAGRASMATLNEIMLERAGLGETGETYLLGPNHALLTGLRFGTPDGGVGTYVRTEGADVALEAHSNGSRLYNGYRGVPVVGVYHWLPGLQVALLAEQNQSEAFHPTYATLGVDVGVAVAAVVVAVVAALFVTRSIAVPLSNLAATAAQIAAGDLERVAKVGRADEIGALAQAFNSMTARLRGLISSLEQRVAERTAELEAFAYSVSHDLRAPLRAMQGFADALLEDYSSQLDSPGQEYARRIVAAAQRMDTLILDLLAYSRLGRAEMRLKPVSLAQVVEEALAQLEAEIKKKDAQMAVEKPLPEAVGHYPTLVQVIANLLSNAVKFVAPGVRPHVRVWAEEQEGQVCLWVEDKGIGIAPEYQERIFRVFERLHGIEAYPGTGIGLAIVKKGMERMGGQVGVESQVGQGSRFWVKLNKA